MSLTIRLLVTLAFMGALFAASAVPGRPQAGDSAFVWLIASIPTLLQKILHICVYATLTMLWAWTLESLQSNLVRLILAITLAVGFGALTEWYQTTVPGRFGTIFDVMLNAVGALTGLILAIWRL